MANKKISQLPLGNPALAGDLFPVDRAGGNFSVTAGSIAALAPSPTLPATKATITSNFLTSYDSTTGLFTATQPAYSDISGAPASGTVLWSALGSATGALSLANAGYATTFNQTSAVNWTWANTTTSGAPNLIVASGTYWSAAGYVTSMTTSAFTAVLGNLIVVRAPTTTTGISDLAGNTYILAATTADAYFYTCASSLARAGNTVTVTLPSTQYIGLWALEFAGVGLLDATPAAASGSGTTYTSTAFTTAQNNELILAFTNTSTAAGIPTGFSDVAGSWAGWRAAYKFVGSIQTNATVTGSVTSGSWVIDVLTFRTTSNLAGQQSPILNIDGTYWNGSTSATDAWTIQNVLGTLATNPTSTLTFAHTGSTGVAAVQVPILNAVTDIMSPLYLFTSAADAGISRLGAASLAIGNGTAGDTSGKLTLASVYAPVVVNAQVASYTAALVDADQLVTLTVASANTFTVPPNSSVAFPVGTVLSVIQGGAGQITLTAGAGVTIDTPSLLTSRAQWSTISVVQISANTWVAGGDIN